MSVEQDGNPLIAPKERPKRKFNIDKVAGSATSLRRIDPDDRWFEEDLVAEVAEREALQ